MFIYFTFQYFLQKHLGITRKRELECDGEQCVIRRLKFQERENKLAQKYLREGKMKVINVNNLLNYDDSNKEDDDKEDDDKEDDDYDLNDGFTVNDEEDNEDEDGDDTI